MTTVIFAKNVKDLAEVMLKDTTEGKTYARYTIEQFTEKIYADPKAGKDWRDARLSFNYNTDWNTNEEREQKYAAWEADNPEPTNIIFTSWWLEYRSSKWRTEKIVYLSPELGREIDNHWTSRWDDERIYQIYARLECPRHRVAQSGGGVMGAEIKAILEALVDPLCFAEFCPFCGEEQPKDGNDVHEYDCIVVRARRILAEEYKRTQEVK